MKELLGTYQKALDDNKIETFVDELTAKSAEFNTVINLKRIFGLIDLTTLHVTDNKEKVVPLCRKINNFHDVPRHVGIPNVAAICVYPSLVSFVARELDARNVDIASVAGGFPASQTFISVKTAEAKMAVEIGRASCRERVCHRV